MNAPATFTPALQNRRVTYFPAQDCKVVTGLTAKGEYVAFRQDEELPRGHGHSVLSAIADLVEKLGSTDDDTDPKADRLADARDHARKLREEA